MQIDEKELLSAVEYIVKNNLTLTGKNPDPYGLGGSGPLMYRFTLSNDNVVERDSELRISVESRNICILVNDFKDAARKKIEQADKKVESIKRGLSRYIDE